MKQNNNNIGVYIWGFILGIIFIPLLGFVGFILLSIIVVAIVAMLVKKYNL